MLKHPNQSGLHRDRAVDGPTTRRNVTEREADQFASCFLMPARLVLEHFRDYFGCDFVRLSEESIFGLGMGGGVDRALRQIRSTRDISLLLASANAYMGRHFYPLAQLFRVSPIAMAIRIEELSLVEDFAARRLR
jgi:hypothetical protein